MNSAENADTRSIILEKAKSLGASLVGVANISSLRDSQSYVIYDHNPYYDPYEGVKWPEIARSVVVLALSHGHSKRSLDWWRYDLPGRTRGNEKLIQIAKNLSVYLTEEFKIEASPLSYYVEKGGVFLKDAAVLAGLGIIGKNNLLITPQFGPRLRLKAVFLDIELTPTGPIVFDPCTGCGALCFQACPQDAFRSGSYDRDLCDLQMAADVENQLIIGEAEGDDPPVVCRKYCRACELSCPVAR